MSGSGPNGSGGYGTGSAAMASDDARVARAVHSESCCPGTLSTTTRKGRTVSTGGDTVWSDVRSGRAKVVVPESYGTVARTSPPWAWNSTSKAAAFRRYGPIRG